MLKTYSHIFALCLIAILHTTVLAQVTLVDFTLECLEVDPSNGYIDDFGDSLRLTVIAQIPQEMCDYVQVLIDPLYANGDTLPDFPSLPLLWQTLHCPGGNISGYQFENVVIEPNNPAGYCRATASVTFRPTNDTLLAGEEYLFNVMVRYVDSGVPTEACAYFFQFVTAGCGLLPPICLGAWPVNAFECAESRNSAHGRVDCNGGICNAEFGGTPAYQDILPDQTLLGRAFTYLDSLHDRYNDLDWYRFSVSVPCTAVISMVGEFPVALQASAFPPLTCSYFANYTTGTACRPLVFRYYCPTPGDYVVMASYAGFAPLPISDYKLRLQYVYSADYGSVVISEVMYDDTATADSEWVEIYNTTAETIDLSNWILTDGPTFPPPSTEGAIQIPAGTMIAAGSFLVLSGSSIPQVADEIVCPSIDLTFALNNAGDNLALFNSNGDLIDGSLSIAFPDSSLANAGISIERNNLFAPWSGSGNDWHPSTANFSSSGRYRYCTPSASNSLRVPLITIQRAGAGIQLDWAPVGVAYYKVYAAATRNGTYTLIGTTTTNSYIDTNAVNDHDYRFYKVTSSDSP